MMIRRTASVAAVLALALSGSMAVAGQPQQSPRGNDCADDDLACRLDAIDSRLARIERILGRGGGGNNGVSIAINRYCNPSDCGRMAFVACTTAGFARGAAEELDNSAGTPLLVRAICFD